jgi:hypothetical protein
MGKSNGVRMTLKPRAQRGHAYLSESKVVVDFLSHQRHHAMYSRIAFLKRSKLAWPQTAGQDYSRHAALTW